MFKCLDCDMGHDVWHSYVMSSTLLYEFCCETADAMNSSTHTVQLLGCCVDAILASASRVIYCRDARLFLTSYTPVERTLKRPLSTVAVPAWQQCPTVGTATSDTSVLMTGQGADNNHSDGFKH